MSITQQPVRIFLKHKRVVYCVVIASIVIVLLLLIVDPRSAGLDSSSTSPPHSRSSVEQQIPVSARSQTISSMSPNKDPMDLVTACELAFPRTFTRLMSRYRSCLLDKLKGRSKWNELPVAISTCLGETLWSTLEIQLLKNMDDTKLAILPAQLDACPKWVGRNFDCVEVTLGVGNDIMAERELRRFLPSCRFYGADPILASGRVFKEIGTYFELAVASQSGIVEASVLEHETYRAKNVTAVPFVEFFRDHAKVDHIDYLFMDNEGPEYPFLEQLAPGGAVANSRLTICQISIELHGPLHAYYAMNESRFDELIEKTVTSSGYLPFWVTYAGEHIRSLFLNVRDPYCLETFYMSKFCKDQCR